MRDADARHEDALDALTLLGIPRIGLRDWHRRVATFGSATAALARIPQSAECAAARRDAASALDGARDLGIRVLVHGDADYPSGLHDLTRCDSNTLSPAPPVLFALGDLSLLQRPAVAIVGTRHASATGLRAASVGEDPHAGAGIAPVPAGVSIVAIGS